jgi:hypothetical protein
MMSSYLAIPFVDQLVVVTAVIVGALCAFVIGSSVIAKFVELCTRY